DQDPPLTYREGSDTKRLIGMFLGVMDNCFRDNLSLDGIGRGVPAVEYPVPYKIELQPHAGIAGVGARHDEELVVVKLAVRHGDQRLVTAPVVPAQHAARNSLGGAQTEDALDIGGLCGTVLDVFLIGAAAGQFAEK